jgi:tetratricopeptide (TPR) repeat protein
MGLIPIWREQSLVTEVFSLHIFCATLLLWTLAVSKDNLLDFAPSAALGLIFGLGLGGHQTLILILPALLLFGQGKPGRWSVALGAAALGASVGFTLHAMIPLRAMKSPPLDWDHAITVESFWRLITRKDYGTLSLTVDGGQAPGLASFAQQALRSLRGIQNQLGLGATALAVIGLATWRRWPQKLSFAAVLVWITMSGPVFFMMGRPPMDAQTSSALTRFYLLPILGVGILMAAGIEWCDRTRRALAVCVVGMAMAVMIPTAFQQSRRGDYLAHDYGRMLMRQLPPHAVFVMDGGDDTFYTTAYFKYALGQRSDLTLHDRGGVVFPGLYGQDFRRLHREEKEPRRRIIEGVLAKQGALWYSTLNPDLIPGWPSHPAGLIRRPLLPTDRFIEAEAYGQTMVLPRYPSALENYRDRGLLAFIHYQRGLASFARDDLASGLGWMELSADIGHDVLWVPSTISYVLRMQGYRATLRQHWSSAESIYRALIRVGTTKADSLADLGVVLQRQARFKEAENSMREALSIDSHNIHAWQALGALLWAMSRWQECAQAYDSAASLAADGTHDAAWALKARQRLRL